MMVGGASGWFSGYLLGISAPLASPSLSKVCILSGICFHRVFFEVFTVLHYFSARRQQSQVGILTKTFLIRKNIIYIYFISMEIICEATSALVSLLCWELVVTGGLYFSASVSLTQERSHFLKIELPSIKVMALKHLTVEKCHLIHVLKKGLVISDLLCL